MTWIAAYLVSGAFVGFLAGLIGIGGGMTLVPILSALFSAQGLAPGYSVHLALGTAMASTLFTSFSSVREHHRLGSVDWQIVRRMVPGLMFGSLVSTGAAGWLSQGTLAILFALIASAGATQMLRASRPVAARPLPGPLPLFAWMSAIGATCGLVSAGGAFLTVPFMVYCGVPMRNAIGSGAAMAWPIALIGTTGYVVSGWPAMAGLPDYALGFVLLPVLAVLVAASMLAAPFGARMTHRLPTLALKRIFAVMLYLVALKMATAYW